MLRAGNPCHETCCDEIGSFNKMSKISKSKTSKALKAKKETKFKTLSPRHGIGQDKARGNHLHEIIKKSIMHVPKGQEQKWVVLRNEANTVKVTGDSDMSTASAFMSPNQVYRFKLQGFSTITSNGSGIIAVSVPMDPSSAGFNFSEWTDLAALFDEVKLQGFRVQIVAFSNSTPSLIFSPMVIGTNLVSSSAPATEGAVATLTDASYHPSTMTNSSGFYHSFSNHGIIGWSSTASVTDQPYAGCPGSMLMYVNNFSVSTLAFKVLVQGFYEFRARS